jgi:hypothetical protein
LAGILLGRFFNLKEALQKILIVDNQHLAQVKKLNGKPSLIFQVFLDKFVYEGRLTAGLGP